jgi:hypothetical protein
MKCVSIISVIGLTLASPALASNSGNPFDDPFFKRHFDTPFFRNAFDDPFFQGASPLRRETTTVTYDDGETKVTITRETPASRPERKVSEPSESTPKEDLEQKAAAMKMLLQCVDNGGILKRGFDLNDYVGVGEYYNHLNDAWVQLCKNPFIKGLRAGKYMHSETNKLMMRQFEIITEFLSNLKDSSIEDYLEAMRPSKPSEVKKTVQPAKVTEEKKDSQSKMPSNPEEVRQILHKVLPAFDNLREKYAQRLLRKGPLPSDQIREETLEDKANKKFLTETVFLFEEFFKLIDTFSYKDPKEKKALLDLYYSAERKIGKLKEKCPSIFPTDQEVKGIEGLKELSPIAELLDNLVKAYKNGDEELRRDLLESIQTTGDDFLDNTYVQHTLASAEDFNARAPETAEHKELWSLIIRLAREVNEIVLVKKPAVQVDDKGKGEESPRKIPSRPLQRSASMEGIRVKPMAEMLPMKDSMEGIKVYAMEEVTPWLCKTFCVNGVLAGPFINGFTYPFSRWTLA